MNWDLFWVGMAHYVSQKSKDDSMKVGCVLVTPDNDFITFGFNGFPRGVRETETIVDLVPYESGMEYPEGSVDAYRDGRRFVQIPRQVLIGDRWHKRPEKYSYVEHAERNAVFNAARKGLSTIGSIAYLNYEPNPCSDCARSLIQAGIVEVRGPNRLFKGKGAGVHYHLYGATVEMFQEAGVKQTVIEGIDLEAAESSG